MIFDTTVPATQETLGRLVGVGQPRISQMVGAGLIPEGAALGEQLLAYCAHLRESAAGRATAGPLDLAQERAALARSQREGVDLRNAIARGEYAEVRLLEQLLAAAAQTVVDRFDHLPAQLHTACPDLPQSAVDTLMSTVAQARNEWSRATARLVVEQVLAADDEIEVDGGDDADAA